MFRTNPAPGAGASTSAAPAQGASGWFHAAGSHKTKGEALGQPHSFRDGHLIK